MQEIDIEKIIAEIKEEIAQKGYKESELSFRDISVPVTADINKDDISNELEFLNGHHIHDVNMPVSATNLIARIIKNIIRKLVKFLFYPVLALQNSCNSSIVRILMGLNTKKVDQEELMHQVANLQEQITALNMEIKKIKEE